ncbi:MAG TPA: hypothetical protein VL001_14275 [Candidimonas sp.]|nr:hypothetical protein [Candidimonas sp.]
MRHRPTLWRAVAGPAVWLLFLVVVYTAHALGCRYVDIYPAGATASSAILTLVLIIVWLLFLAGAVLLGWQSRVRRRAASVTGRSQAEVVQFMTRLTLIADISAIAAIVATGLPIAAVPACG